MDERGFREYLASQTPYQRGAARARRLGRPYTGFDSTVDRVREFVSYLAEHRARTPAEADAADMRAFMEWLGRRARVAPGTYRGAIGAYLAFVGADVPAEEAEVAQERADWGRYVKVRKLKRRLAYGFVKELLDLAMPQAADLARRPHRENAKVRGSGDPDDTPLASLLAAFARLDAHGVRRVSDFVAAAVTTPQAQRLAATTGVPLQDLRQLLQWVDRELVPEQKHLGVLLHQGDARLNAAAAKLAPLKLANNLALLDAGRTAAGRERIARDCGIAPDELMELLHRADISRKCDVARTVDCFVKAGYDTFAEIAVADAEEFKQRVLACARDRGITSPAMVDWAYVAYARTFPPVLDC